MLQDVRGLASGYRASRALLVLAALLVLGGVACVAREPGVVSERVRVTPTETAATPTTPTTPTNVPVETPTPEPTPYDGTLVVMRIPSLGVEAPIEALGKLPGANQLDVPMPRNIGWYDIYDKPGFGTSSLYSAHKDWYPDIRGPFYELTELQDGDHVVVVMDDGREYVYEVFFQRRFEAGAVPMADLISPHEAEDPELLRPAGEEWAVLITCGGDFIEVEEDGPGYYVHRDVVIAKLVETRPGESVRTVESGN